MNSEFNLTEALYKIKALAIAAGYLFEHDERELQLGLIERMEQVANKALMPQPDAEGEK